MKNSIIWGLVTSCFIWVSCKYATELTRKVVNLSKQPLIVSHHTLPDSLTIQKDTIAPNHEFVIFNGSDFFVPPNAAFIDTIQTENGTVVKKDWNEEENWESRNYEQSGTRKTVSLFFLREEDL
ncbi:MAG: hypothetical protein ACKVTZ_06950 [Bacteroidia bacterium]